jgi:hypothetical protein
MTEGEVVFLSYSCMQFGQKLASVKFVGQYCNCECKLTTGW